MKKLLAWHFTKGFKLRDGQDLVAGRTYKVEGPLRLCEHGLHASIRAIDALEYAPDTVVSRVECSGDIVHGEDKLVCSQRKVLWCRDVSKELRLCACDCAETALMIAEVTDERCWNAIDVSRGYAVGIATAEQLAAAQYAAWSAAYVAQSVMWDTAQSAAWYATYAAQSAASYATDAAWFATYVAQSAAQSVTYATRSAVYKEAQEDMNKTLEEYLTTKEIS